MKHIAILGFGVVGGGVADLITNNKKEIRELLGYDIEIDYILDLRDFPDSPLGNRVVHDFNIIVNSNVDTVIEAMGGSHPAYEFTMAALRAGKNVITSNKEVVSLYLDEFLATAKEMGVVYRFEASVGGGIPVISPLISLLRHNKIHEIRGILNGTTNYILTKMFDFGESFENALKDAQARGYAERIPDADVLGLDAARKISILASLVSGRLVDVSEVKTEGITNIRGIDIEHLAKRDMRVKLIGRVNFDNGVTVSVCPHAVASDMLLSGVMGVYNAVEVVAEPLGNVVFYGQGAGAGATASAMVSDLTLTYAEGTSYAVPTVSGKLALSDADTTECRFYVALAGEDIPEEFAECDIVAKTGGEVAFFTEKISRASLEAILQDDTVCAIIPVL